MNNGADDVDDDSAPALEETVVSRQKLHTSGSRALKAMYWNYLEIILKAVGGCTSQADP